MSSSFLTQIYFQQFIFLVISKVPTSRQSPNLVEMREKPIKANRLVLMFLCSAPRLYVLSGITREIFVCCLLLCDVWRKHVRNSAPDLCWCFVIYTRNEGFFFGFFLVHFHLRNSQKCTLRFS